MKTFIVVVLMLSCLSVFAQDIDFNQENVNILGYNPTPTTTLEAMSDTSYEVVNYLTVEVVLNVSSSSTSDTAAGVGARTVTITGLDDDWKPISDVVTLNGTTAEVTTKKFFRINKVEVTTAGTTAYNVGDIYLSTGPITSGVPSTTPATRTFAKINATNNRTLSSAYSTQAGSSLVINSIATGGATYGGSFIIKKRLSGGIFVPIGVNTGTVADDLSIVVDSKTDICVFSLHASATTPQFCSINGVLSK